MTIFNVDFDKWIAQLLPTFMRKRRLFAFCRSICSPLYLTNSGLYQRFLDVRSDHIYRLSHNGQVCYLRAALNDAFGISKGFEIEDVDSYDGEWQYAKDGTEKVNMPEQLTPVDEQLNANISTSTKPDHPMPILADEAQLNALHNSFIVRVPSNIYNSQLDKVKTIVEKYRILSKTPIYTKTKAIYEQGGIFVNGGREWWQWPISIVNTGVDLYTGSN